MIIIALLYLILFYLIVDLIGFISTVLFFSGYYLRWKSLWTKASAKYLNYNTLFFLSN